MFEICFHRFVYFYLLGGGVVTFPFFYSKTSCLDVKLYYICTELKGFVVKSLVFKINEGLYRLFDV